MEGSKAFGDFGSSQDLSQTIRHYTDVFTRLVVFTIRTFLIREIPPPEEVSPALSAAVFTEAQAKACRALARALGLLPPPPPEFPTETPGAPAEDPSAPFAPPPNHMELLHALALSVVQYRFQHEESPRHSSIASMFVLSSSVTPDNSWASDNQISKNFTALAWAFRLVTFKAIHDQARSDPASYTEDSAYANHLTYLDREHPTMFEYLSSMASRLHTIKLSSYAPATVEVDGTDFLVGGRRAPFQRVKQMIWNPRTELKNGLAELLGLLDGEHLLLRNFHDLDIVDDLIRDDPGYSFLDDPANTCFADPQLLFRNMMKSEKFARVLGGALCWDLVAVEDILNRVHRLKLLMLVFHHISCGGAPRGTEETAAQVCNTHGRRRTVIYHLNRVIFVGEYCKQSHVGADLAIHRAVDYEASNWVIIILRWINHLTYMIESIIYLVSTAITPVSTPPTHHSSIRLSGTRRPGHQRAQLRVLGS